MTTVIFWVILLPVILIVLIFLSSAIDTNSNGIYSQTRIGKNGKPFTIYKFRTWHKRTNTISCYGHFLRKYKIDELPQLYNLFVGDMALIGPRPDVPGYADQLIGEDRIILSVKPGITGLASIKYKNEEELLSKHPNPIWYNEKIIWADKVKINKWYVKNKSLWLNIMILICTIFPLKFNVDEIIKK